MLSYLRHKMSHSKLSAEARMLSLAILLINIPSTVFGLAYYWLVLPIPGLILYGCFIAIVLDKLKRDLIKTVSALAILYHSTLLLIMIVRLGDLYPQDFMAWSYISSIPVATICFCIVLLRNFNEAQTHETN
ncbi:MAG: hypothetical protein AAFN10_00645 [Bacteroidota bacterium]